MTFLPSLDTPSLWEQAEGPLTPEQQDALLHTPSQEDQEWFAQQVWANLP